MSTFDDMADSVLDITQTVFGQSVTYTPVVGDAQTINGVFENVSIELDNGTISKAPSLFIKLGDLDVTPAKGDTVTISAVVYSVLGSEVDGYGGSRLILQKQ